MTGRLGIIGTPLAHSISPAMHQAALDHYALDMTYEAWEVPIGGLQNFFREMRTSDTGIQGCSITVPHKELAIEFLDETSEDARRAGAVNTVVNTQGRLSGYNTDGAGFLRALQSEAGVSPAGKRVLILGAGGAARGVLMALSALDPSSITIANRNSDRANNLVKQLKRQSKGRADAMSLTDRKLPDTALNADLIIQCTTVGMRHGPDEGGLPLAAAHIPPTALVYDLVYNPAETPLMRVAAACGAQVLGGLSMLVHQGAIAFEMWTGRPAPVDVMFEAARSALPGQAS